MVCTGDMCNFKWDKKVELSEISRKETIHASHVVVTEILSISFCSFHKQISRSLRSFRDLADLYMLFGSEFIGDL